MKKTLKFYPCRVLLLFLLVFGLSVLAPLKAAFATHPDFIDQFAANDIMFYNPNGCVMGQGSSGTSSSGSAVKIAGSEVSEKIWSGLKSLGYSDEQVAGILGNMLHESGALNPAQHEGSFRDEWETYPLNTHADKSYGIGLIQWSFGRRVNLYNFIKDKDPDIVKYLDKPSEYSAANGNSYGMSGEALLKKIGAQDFDKLVGYELEFLDQELRSSYSGFLKTTTVDEAAAYFLEKIEVPANPYVSAHPERLEDAKTFYDKLHGKTIASGNIDPCLCDDQPKTAGSGMFAGKKYNLNDEQLKGLVAIAKEENGFSLTSIKSVLSQMVNLFERNGKKYSQDGNGFVDYILHGGWYGKTRATERYNNAAGVTDEELKAARDILVNGNRTLPTQVVEYDDIGDITSATNDGKPIDKNDKNQYQSGKTIIHNKYGSTYVFYTWADPETKKGDPFGYFADKPPGESASNNSGIKRSTASWKDGWLEKGLDGFTKEDGKKSVSTNAAKKIYVHAANTVDNGGQGGILALYGNGDLPHFTVDLKNHKTYQHLPITGSTNYGGSEGIHINILGYATAEEAKKAGQDMWDLSNKSNFSDADFDYLNQVILGISEQNKIDLGRDLDASAAGASDRISDAAKRSGATGSQECSLSSSGDVNALQQVVKSFVNPQYIGVGKAGAMKKTAAYQAIIDKSKYQGGFNGVDCGAYVYNVMVTSGWDPDYMPSMVRHQIKYLRASKKWTDVTSTIKSNADARPGDVIIICEGGEDCPRRGHVLLFSGKVPGVDSEMTSASLGERAPMADLAKDISYYVKEGYSIFRKTGN